MDILIDPAFGRTADQTTIYARWDHNGVLGAVGTATTHDSVPRYRVHMRDGTELRCYTREWLYSVIRAYLKTHTSLLVVEAEPTEPPAERTVEDKLALHNALHEMHRRRLEAEQRVTEWNEREDRIVNQIIHDYTGRKTS
jgi:hypothetical protein